ncbi:MAG: beta-L-arabinofuranosidase domain-containing protein [Bryobacteraceae bacterium]
MMPNLTRRTLLKGAASTALAASTASKLCSTTLPNPPLTVFPYGAVSLLPGPLKQQFDQTHSFFLNLSEDRLLKIYRQRVGLPAPGEDMGGWYDDFCPGAHFGQYVSGLARFAAATNSEPTRAKVKRLVRAYAETVDPSGKFFVDLRYPGYTYDKLVCGLLDAHSWAGDETAVSVLYATTRAAKPHMPDHALTAEEQQQRPHKDETYTWDETYTMAENLFLAYERTGDPMFFDMGKRYLLDRTFFDPLAEEQDVLPGLHAYSHVNALSSGMQGYLKLGDPKYLHAVNNAVNLIWKDQSFATGGWGPNEAFVEPGKGQLGASLSNTRRSFETPCGSYAHFKVMRYLLLLTTDARYGDSMERVLYNTILGALPVREDGSSFYYSDYHHSGVKTYRRDIPDAVYRWDHDARWPCCSGTLPQVVADYTISAYFRSADGIYVNLYVPSQVTWMANSVRCSLSQQTAYPTDSLVTMRMELTQPQEFALNLRIPAWAGNQTSISVNGTRLKATPSPGTFFPLRRSWKTGDLVELHIDQPVRTEGADPQNADQVALLRGPQVLFAISPQQPQLPREQLGRLQPSKAQNGDWILDLDQSNLVLRPFANIRDEVYQTYSKVASA